MSHRHIILPAKQVRCIRTGMGDGLHFTEQQDHIQRVMRRSRHTPNMYVVLKKVVERVEWVFSFTRAILHVVKITKSFEIVVCGKIWHLDPSIHKSQH